MARATPSDSDRVIGALRLGWAVSELRGRLRPGEKLVHIKQLDEPLRTGHTLPLGGERTQLEQLKEAEAVVCSLAAELKVDSNVDQFADADGTISKPASERLIDLAKALSRSRKPEAPADADEESWKEMASFLYQWDAKIQDLLAGGAFSVQSAYQLGRGLGEIAWLDPTQESADDSTSWAQVLGKRRVGTLQRLVKRLEDYFQPLTARGVSVGLGAWGATVEDTVEDKKLRTSVDGRNRLTEQTRRWRDVLLTGLDPATLLPPQRFVARARQVRHVLRAFWPELIVAAVSVLVTATAAALLATEHKGLAAALGVIGLSGATASGAVAKAKTQALALIGKLREALDADLIVEAVVVRPRAAPSKRFGIL